MEFSTYNNHLSISNSEDGFMVATRGTSMYVGRQAPDFNPFKNNKENEKALKGKVSSLLRQQRSLEEIKQRNTKDKSVYINSFNVPEECIETSDIVFNKCWSFTVASVTFNYEGEIKNKASTSVKLCTQAIKCLCNDPRNKKLF
jgi:hypothetical protein